MPNFSNYNNVEANYTEGGFKQVIPGAYVAVVQVVRTNWTERNYDTGLDDSYQTITIDPATGMTRGNEPGVMFVFDIAEGEFAGEYSRDFYMSGIEPNPEKDFIHRWKFHWGDLNNEKDAAKAKYILEQFTASNPGFDALVAFNADAWPLFVGKKFGVVLNGTVRTNDKGYDQWNLRTSAKIYSVQDIANGDHAEPRITDRRTKVAAESSTVSGGQAEQVPAEIYDDLPFV